MTMSDPIADMLTRIRNANTAKHDSVDVPSSKIKTSIAKILLDEGYITNVAVKKDCRNCGIGKELLSKVDKKADALGLSFISLEVRQSNVAAISLYEKQGYKNEGVRKNFYKSPVENAIIMTKRRTI